jgi:putative Mg2+ transporter-C (MgtC) family protein
VIDPSGAETVGRLVLAAALGGAIGLERELDSQPAGLRTHLLVGLGSAVFTLAGIGLVGSDPARIAAQIVAGIGFLGAGAILHDAGRIKGLTTAASLWVTASLGLATGFGRYLVAVSAAVLALVVLSVLKRVERTLFPQHRGESLSVDVASGTELAPLMRAVEAVTGPMDIREVERSADGGQRFVGSVRPGAMSTVALVEQLLSIEGVRGVDIRA